MPNIIRPTIDFPTAAASVIAEVRAWHAGLNHRNINKAKVGATYSFRDGADRSFKEMHAAAQEMLALMEDAIGVHVYSLEDGDVIPADCQYLLSIERMRSALGLPASTIARGPAAMT